MKKIVLLALLLPGLAEGIAPAAAAPCHTTTVSRDPNQMERTRRHLRRQAMMRMRRNRRNHHA